jgi:hypothetical protein
MNMIIVLSVFTVFALGAYIVFLIQRRKVNRK